MVALVLSPPSRVSKDVSKAARHAILTLFPSPFLVTVKNRAATAAGPSQSTGQDVLLAETVTVRLPTVQQMTNQPPAIQAVAMQAEAAKESFEPLAPIPNKAFAGLDPVEALTCAREAAQLRGYRVLVASTRSTGEGDLRARELQCFYGKRKNVDAEMNPCPFTATVEPVDGYWKFCGRNGNHNHGADLSLTPLIIHAKLKLTPRHKPTSSDGSSTECARAKGAPTASPLQRFSAGSAPFAPRSSVPGQKEIARPRKVGVKKPAFAAVDDVEPTSSKRKASRR